MKILFIGNSHTYMNDMPELTRQMIEAIAEEPCEVFILAYSGRSLKWHIEKEYFSVRFNLLYGGYDYCVIQEQAHPMREEADTVAAVQRIIGLCKRANTVPVIFETWAEKAKPENQTEMNRRYRKIAEDQGGLLAPIGEVWQAVQTDLTHIPDADLYFRDGEHASAIGDYLIAMVLTGTITGKLPDPSFLQAFDFSVPDRFQPVKENAEEEMIQLPKTITDLIRKHVRTLL